MSEREEAPALSIAQAPCPVPGRRPAVSSDWTSTWHSAPPALSSVLAGVWAVRASEHSDLHARVLPDGSTSLVFQRDGTVLRTEDFESNSWRDTLAAGPRTRPFEFELKAGGQMLIVQLQPAGAARALGIPMSSLANRFESLDQVVGQKTQRIGDLVRQGFDDGHAVQAIERWLGERTRSSACPPDATDVAVHEMNRRAGRLRVGDLAEHVNLSRRQLGRLMNERVGIAPKIFARLARFNRALHLARTKPTAGWVGIALDAGYADQAHMTREFVGLGGIRPTDLRGPSAATIW